MFTKGTLVVYGSGGVFRIDDVREEKFGTESRRYYVMSTTGGAPTTVFVPVDNEALVKKMKPLISRDGIESLISAMPLETIEWCPDTKARAEIFKKILESGDRAELLRLMRTVYQKKQELAAVGKRIYAADENAMKKAERMIFDEFSAVLGIGDDEIIQMIAKKAEA